MGVDALRLEPRLAGQAAQDEEDAGARERAAARIEEQLRPVALVEVRATPREVEAKGLRGIASDRDDALLVPLAQAADEAVLEVDRLGVEGAGLGPAQACAVQKLAEGAVAEGARCRSGRRVEEPLDFGGGERPRQ